jgi:hypothetical protein
MSLTRNEKVFDNKNQQVKIYSEEKIFIFLLLLIEDFNDLHKDCGFSCFILRDRNCCKFEIEIVIKKLLQFLTLLQICLVLNIRFGARVIGA